MSDVALFTAIIATACLLRHYLNLPRPWFRVIVTLGRDIGEPVSWNDGVRVVHEETILLWDSYLNRDEIARHVPNVGETWGECEVKHVAIIKL